MIKPSVQELLRLGRHSEAEQLLLEICSGSGADAESWFFLGVLSGMRGAPSGAESCFRNALTLNPDFIQARFNLGVALRDQGRLDESSSELNSVLKSQPQHAEAQNVLGNILMRLDNIDEAERCFRSALTVNPAFAEALTNLGNVLALRQSWDEAVDCHRRALVVAPAYAGAAMNLGRVLVSLGRFDEAESAFKHAIMVDPVNADAHVQLGSILNHAGKRPEAERSFRKALHLNPLHGEASFFLAVMGVLERPVSAPPEYVSKLFDGYASTFDDELVGKLQYQAPEALLDAVQSALGQPRDLDVMDLGCGTGLCGALFKPFARSLSGVDLSPKMVAKAHSRGIYDDLEIGDLTPALRKRTSALDVVLAADVFIYVGELLPVFAAAASALRLMGLFAFSVESVKPDEGEGFVLRGSGRYAHSHTYLEKLAQQFGFVPVSIDEICLRLDADQPVNGAVYVFKRADARVSDDSHDLALDDVGTEVAKQRTPAETQQVAKKNYEAFLASIPSEIHRREERLPTDLKLMNAKPLVKLARIRKSVETLFAYADGHIACRKGCAYCCHQAIDISRIEAEYIGEKTGIVPVNVGKVVPRDPLSFSGNTPCPFLKKGACSIYEHRPLICRIHVSLDVDSYWCEFDNWHKPGGSVPKPTFHSVFKAFTELNQQSGSVVADIRDFFPLVPDQG